MGEVLSTEQKVKMAQNYIRHHNVVDEDLKQDIYLTALTVSTRPSFHRKAKKLVEEQSSIDDFEESLEAFMDDKNASEDEIITILDLANQERESNELESLRIKLLGEALDDVISSTGLTRLEKLVLRSRFVDQLTLLQIAELIGRRSPERVRQIEAKALRKLRYISTVKKNLQSYIYE